MYLETLNGFLDKYQFDNFSTKSQYSKLIQLLKISFPEYESNKINSFV